MTSGTTPVAGLNGRLEGRFIGLGVTGSIAAFKAVELLRLLSAEGADVSVMMTASATHFVGPLTFAARDFAHRQPLVSPEPEAFEQIFGPTFFVV